MDVEPVEQVKPVQSVESVTTDVTAATEGTESEPDAISTTDTKPVTTDPMDVDIASGLCETCIHSKQKQKVICCKAS